MNAPYPGDSYYRLAYKGNLVTGTPNSEGSSIASPESTNAQLDALGTTAIARCAPTNPASNLATMLGELLKDGLPSPVGAESWKARTLSAKQAGSEYLNVQFGWAPLISDIRKFADAITHAEKILRQYERDAGKLVRRRYDFPEITSTKEEVYGNGSINRYFWPGVNFFPLKTTATVTMRETVSKKQWFSGAFTYYLPTGYDSRKELSRLRSYAQKLLGIEPTPEVLWELAPWSWAVDWFSNTGDVLKNVSRFTGPGGLVMPYGYMMETSFIVRTYSFSPSPFSGISETPDPITVTTIVKKRRRATPFGFGLSWNALSAFQWSILGALGLTKNRR